MEDGCVLMSSGTSACMDRSIGIVVAVEYDDEGEVGVVGDGDRVRSSSELVRGKSVRLIVDSSVASMRATSADLCCPSRKPQGY